MNEIVIKDINITDLRFPTSKDGSGRDARSHDPDYSCVYLTYITTNPNLTGIATIFTLGRGNSSIIAVVEEQKRQIIGLNLEYIVQNFLQIWNNLVTDSQLYWNGPDKGVVHQANAGLINGLWDLWAKYENKPVWRLVVDLSVDQLLKLLPFQYLNSTITPEIARDILTEAKKTKTQQIEEMEKSGYPAYITCGWSGYSDMQIKAHLTNGLQQGITAFKMKVTSNLAETSKRASLIRDVIGTNNMLSMDANGIWDTQTAIKMMQHLKAYKPYWIEEPTHPDDIIGHANIAKAIKPILVATGEQCSNRIMFRQYLEVGALQVLQTDIQRLAGINEWLIVILMAKIHGVKFCLHAGGIGLPNMGAHLCMIDFISVSNSKKGNYAEYVDILAEHFVNPTELINGSYYPPKVPGFGLEIKTESINKYSFPNGNYWRNPKQKETLINKGWWNYTILY